MKPPTVGNYVKNSELPILQIIRLMSPWQAVSIIETIVIPSLLETLDLSQYHATDNQYIHKSAIVESTAQLKGPMLIGPSCFVANGSLLRGGVILDANCIVGHCCELKTSIMMSESKLAHLSFAGDSILGCGSNIEGGAVIANYRNECENKEIIIHFNGQKIKTGVDKFGAIIGDNTKVGANSVTSPGTLLLDNTIVKRGSVIDQSAF